MEKKSSRLSSRGWPYCRNRSMKINMI